MPKNSHPTHSFQRGLDLPHQHGGAQLPVLHLRAGTTQKHSCVTAHWYVNAAATTEFCVTDVSAHTPIPLSMSDFFCRYFVRSLRFLGVFFFTSVFSFIPFLPMRVLLLLLLLLPILSLHYPLLTTPILTPPPSHPVLLLPCLSILNYIAYSRPWQDLHCCGRHVQLLPLVSNGQGCLYGSDQAPRRTANQGLPGHYGL